MIEQTLQVLRTKYLPYCWIFVFPGAALLSLELTFEKTYLSWMYGTQMIGFAFSTLFPPVVIICILSFYLCYAWLGLFGITAIGTRVRPPKSDLMRIGLTVGILLLERIPVEVWQWVLVLFLGESSHSSFPDFRNPLPLSPT
jgi:hypothetical protein